MLLRRELGADTWENATVVERYLSPSSDERNCRRFSDLHEAAAPVTRRFNRCDERRRRRKSVRHVSSVLTKIAVGSKSFGYLQFCSVLGILVR